MNPSALRVTVRDVARAAGVSQPTASLVLGNHPTARVAPATRPRVLADEPSEQWPGVASNARDAGRQAAEHLLALGHTRLAFIGPAADVHAFRMRERGFVQRLRDAGLTIPSPLLRRASATAKGGDE